MVLFQQLFVYHSSSLAGVIVFVIHTRYTKSQSVRMLTSRIHGRMHGNLYSSNYSPKHGFRYILLLSLRFCVLHFFVCCCFVLFMVHGKTECRYQPNITCTVSMPFMRHIYAVETIHGVLITNSWMCLNNADYYYFTFHGSHRIAYVEMWC